MAMAMGHRVQHTVIIVVLVVIRRIVARHQHGYGEVVGNGNGDGYGDAKRWQGQRYNNQPQDRGDVTVVGAVATTTKRVDTALPSTMDCCATSADDRSD